MMTFSILVSFQFSEGLFVNDFCVTEFYGRISSAGHFDNVFRFFISEQRTVRVTLHSFVERTMNHVFASGPSFPVKPSGLVLFEDKHYCVTSLPVFSW
jgi:hypothetical protein